MAGFPVKMLSKTVVAATLSPAEHRLPQSNLDLLILAKIDMHTFFCYRKPPGNGHTFVSMVTVLKEALSKTLVPYYALAGEMVVNAAGEPELLCNNRGVDFFEAYADVELRELNLYNPKESIHGKLVPALKDGVVAVQVTQLSCGGVVVGCTFDHRVGDAHSANMFWKSWAEMAQSKSISCVPTYHRSLLSPRCPGRFDTSVTNLYASIPRFQYFDIPTINTEITSRIYCIPAEQIEKLRLLANFENTSSVIRKRTKFEAFSAFIWKLVASGTKSRDNFCRLGIAVNGRTRMANGSMCNYFGNLVSYSFGQMRNKELEELPLSSIANEINKFLAMAITEEHFLGLIDYIEANKPGQVVQTMHEGRENRENQHLVVSSALGFSIAKMNFGWGVPVFGSNLCPPEMPFSFVMPMPDPSENGDWIVYICLPEDQIKLIENNAAHILKPFTLG